ncbi:MAG: sodium/proline symporter [Planctomycetota bacterium]
MDRATIVLVTLVVYKIVLVAIGFLARGRNRDEADFFLGGRGLGPVIAAFSASASSSSAWTLLGASGFAWKEGLAALWLFPACVGGFVLNWLVVAPALRRHPDGRRAVTITDFLAADGRGGTSRGIRVLASLIVVVTFVVYVAAQMKAAGGAFEHVLGYDVRTSIVIGAAIVLFYTLLGGFWAVSLTDTLQGAMMVLAAVILPAVAFAHLGAGGLVEGIRAVDQPGYASLFGHGAGPAAFGFAMGLLGIGLGYPGQPHVVNRFLALREGPAALARARVVALGWAVLVYTGMILLGLCGRVLFETLPDGKQESLLFHAADTYLHPIVAGVIIAAVLSAVMSTADSQLLVAASSMTHDLGLDWGAQRRSLLVSRLAIVAVVVLSVVLALAKDATIFDRVIYAWSAIGAAFGPLLAVKLMGARPRPGLAMTSMAVGFASVALHREAMERFGVPGDWGGICQNVLPYLASGLVLAPAVLNRPPARELSPEGPSR